MCGITGIISRQKIEKKIIQKMTQTLAHRGPDGYGYYYETNCAFGHRRLSIVDLTEAGRQPMKYQNRYVITYNGEIYNYLELRQELTALGYRFKSHTDTEVIMAAYDAWGTNCLKKFNGMWAFVIYDRQKKVFFISRDRFGKKPLYYYKNKDTFIFASEIKAILAHPQVPTLPNLVFLDNYVKFGCKEYVTETAFKDIFRFKFSCYFEGTLDDLLSDFKQNQFWELKVNLSKEKFNETKAKEYAQRYYELLEDAVKIRLRADVKVGSALSGGLDSSSIVYLVNKLLRQQGQQTLQETFSSVYKSYYTQNCDESYFIDMMAQKLEVHSNQIEPQESDIPAEIKKMMWYLENPPENSLMSSWHTFKLVASTEVKVTLDGQGADEQLAGYLFYITVYLSSLNLWEIIKEANEFLKVPGATKYVVSGTILGVTRYLIGQKILKWLIKKFLKREFEFNLNKKLAEDTMTSLITLIHYADHTSMAFGIESRMPFMDYRLVEFLASVPACYKMRNGWTKYLARLAFDGKLPHDITWRKDKMGWPIPESQWFNGKLREWFLSEIQNSKLLQRYRVDIEKKLAAKVGLEKLIRYLNIAQFEKIWNWTGYNL